MTAQPFLLQMPDPDQSPARSLVGGFDTFVIYAATAADAQAVAANVGGRVWDNSSLVTPQPLSPAANMTGWRFRITLFDNLGNFVTDQTVLASANSSFATGFAALSGAPSDGDQFTFGSTTYTFKTSLGVTAHNVLIGGSAVNSILHLVQAITFDNGLGTNAGTNYVGTTPDPAVTAVVDHTTNTQADITALLPGTQGNSIALAATTNVSTNLSVSGADLAGATGLTPTVSAMAAAMVVLLNDAGVGISHASFNSGSHTLTVAGSADNLGNYFFQANFYPPAPGFAAAHNADSPNSADDVEQDFYQSDYLNTAGVVTVEAFGVPGFIGTLTDGGSAGSALTVVVAADTYTIPTVLVSARAQY